jgi:PilZ domain
MNGDPGVDYPDHGNEVQMSVPGGGVTVDCRTVSAQDGVLVLKTLGLDEPKRVNLRAGDRVEIFWARVLDSRVVPATVAAVEGAAESRWRLQVTGPVEVSQRRTAVRARVAVPVVLAIGERTIEAVTDDLSEGGARIGLAAGEELPEPGTVVDVHLDLNGSELSARAEIIRVITHETGRKFLSVSFPGLSERDQDRIRRRVFQALREERARINA